jgi:diguanylate cyclase (GGDEF)-like protein
MIFSKIRELLSVPGDNPELVQSQVAALSTQIPMLYLILLLNTLGISVTHFYIAPVWLTSYLPAPFIAICIYRIASWSTFRDAAKIHEVAVQRLRGTVHASAMLGACFAAWGCALYQYGDLYHQAHLAFYTSISVIVSVFCLMQLRAAALALTCTALLPTVLFLASTGEPIMVAIATNVALVSVAMMRMLFTQYADFSSLIETQKQLTLRHDETLQLSDMNHRLANLDMLTGLPNRRSFFVEFDALMERTKAKRRTFVVALIDLDGFKAINDLHGHAAGDRLLVETAHRLNAIVRPGIVLARLGGDEFAILICDSEDNNDFTSIGETICEALRVTFTFNSVAVTISGSVGFAIYPQAGTTKEVLLEHADYALMHAKQKNRGSAVIFTQEHETEIRMLNHLDQALRHANLDEEFSVALQPIVDTKTGLIKCYEALSRWNSPKLGTIAPSDFIRAAERSELVSRITLNTLRKTLAKMTGWPVDTIISFNLSARDINSSETVLKILAIVNESNIDPSRLIFEVTETAVMADFDQASDVLRMLQRFGIKIALDDFGSGYSSLGYVHRLPLDVIKIDQVFVKDIETNVSSRSIVKTIASLCTNLDLDCIVEGVETQGQVNALHDLGCAVMQGYFFAMPMSPEAIWPDTNQMEGGGTQLRNAVSG